MYTKSTNSTTQADVESTKCEILGDFGKIVQILLGVLSLMVLVLKRHLEKPKRHWIVWLLDTSKQVFSALLAHFLNMALAVSLSEGSNSDDWDWYFINLSLEVLVGVGLSYWILYVIESIAIKYHIKILNTGNYVNLDYEKDYVIDLDPTKQTEIDQIQYGTYLVQLIVWGSIVVSAKMILFLVQVKFPFIFEYTSKILIGWLDLYPKVKLVWIMVIFPLILNSIQFWVQDNILKAKKSKNIEFWKSFRHRRNRSNIPTKGMEMEVLPYARRTKTTTIDTRHFLGIT